MMVKFEENEYLVMAMFQMENRQQTMREIRSEVPFLKDDAEVLLIVNSTLAKMEKLSDQEFDLLELEPYKQDPVEDE